MADIKTNLRELSVIVGITQYVSEIHYDATPSTFVSICKAVIPTVSEKQYSNISSLVEFNSEQKMIIDNGFELAKSIIEKFKINKIETINWYGFETQKEEPYDISINGLLFSLKEDSFILENMGLYKLLNCYTGSKYKKRHIFSDYARPEYENWFNITWQELLSVLKSNKGTWSYFNAIKKKEGVIKEFENKILFEFFKDGKSIVKSILPQECNLSTFENKTTSNIREEVFAKFINRELDNNIRYNTSKTACAVAATNALAKELNDNLNYSAGLPRFLRIHTNEYYYAKTTALGVEIYKVPALSDFSNNIVIDSIIASVPNKQANILTTIRNVKTGKRLVLRNECRFSHGQFNGTPEAKMYYEAGGSLLTIYESL